MPSGKNRHGLSQDEKYQLLEWPVNSPDFNPIGISGQN